MKCNDRSYGKGPSTRFDGFIVLRISHFGEISKLSLSLHRLKLSFYVFRLGLYGLRLSLKFSSGDFVSLRVVNLIIWSYDKGYSDAAGV